MLDPTISQCTTPAELHCTGHSSGRSPRPQRALACPLPLRHGPDERQGALVFQRFVRYSVVLSFGLEATITAVYIWTMVDQINTFSNKKYNKI